MTEHWQRLILSIVLLAFASLAHAQNEDMSTITDIHHLAAYLMAALLIGLFVMIFSNRVYYYREREISIRSKQLSTQLGLVVSSNNIQVWTYDVARRMFAMISPKGDTKTELLPIDFAQLFDRDDLDALRSYVYGYRDGKQVQDTIRVRGRKENDGTPQKTYAVSVSVLKADDEGKPKVLIGNLRDITDSQKKFEEARMLLMRYHTVFDSSLVDMVFYNEDGFLEDINEKALETFAVKDRETLLQRKVKITDIPSYRDINFENVDSMRLSSITDIDSVKRDDERVPEIKVGGRFYYEAAINVVRDKEGHQHGIITAGRNITDMVENVHRQQNDTLLLKRTTRAIRKYVDNINYTLRVSGVRLVNYYPDTHELEVLSALQQTDYRLSQVRCASLVVPSQRRKARGLMVRMDKRRPGTFNETVCTGLRDKQGRNIHLAVSMVPVYDDNEGISHYFGMLRNVTELVYTEEKLREESKKAQEAEEVKNTFLLNMSYEIRTPLNAVVGFAELFNQPHEKEDEVVFAKEIKKNTNTLLKLVNDILFISRLDARMVEFIYQPCDFAMLFDGYCYMGWSILAPGVKVTVQNPYSQLIVDIDEQSLGEVIQKLCTMASQYTTEGYIRAKYEYRHGELCITIEDTGCGIDEDALQHIFDRFGRDEENQHYGSGLDLPIVKELIEQMGGSIELQSEKGKGTTVYIIIPCKMTSLEKKTDSL